MKITLILLAMFFTQVLAIAGTLNVPAEYPTIQAAVDASADGDIILVAPGEYNENIIFGTKAVTVRSTGGASETTIRGNGAWAVVFFQNTGGADQVLDGFTITNGIGAKIGTSRYGGGVCAYYASPTVVNNIVTGNTAKYGGGICCIESTPAIGSNFVAGNSADSLGGGISLHRCNTTLANNVVAENTAATFGGGIYCVGSSASPYVTMTGNTIAGNTTPGKGGAVFFDANIDCTITNSIMWSNTAAAVGPQMALYAATVTISYSDVQGGRDLVSLENNSILNWLMGMIDADPLFADEDNGDYHLIPSSPCFDAGDTSAPGIGSEDVEGNPRVGGAAVNMGAYEFALDSVPPLVEITAPQDELVTNQTSIVLQADIDEASECTVVSTPAGIDESLAAGGGSVSGTVALENEGDNVLAVTATDAYNNVGSASIVVIRDTLAPGVAIVSPAEGAVLGDSPATVTVSVGDATATSVVFGPHTFNVGIGGGDVSGGVDLVEGPNVIAVTVTDEAGNVTTAGVTVILDLDAPVVAITSPANGAVFGPGDETIPVTMTVDDLSATTIESVPSGVSGALPAGGGLVTGYVALGEGFNNITLTATDATGRESSAAITVNLDTTAPVVELLSPEDGDSISGMIEFVADAIDIEPGSGIDRIELAVDGDIVATIAEPPYTMDFDTTALVDDGAYIFTATAYDGIGNAASVFATVYVDNTPPQVAFVEPLDASFVAGTVGIEVLASEAGSGLAGVEVLSGGEAPTVDPSAVYDPPVMDADLLGSENTLEHPDGALPMSARAIDDAGNEAIADIEVFVDNTAPGKAITSPRDGQKVSGTVSIHVEASDANLSLIEVFVDGQPAGASASSPYTLDFDTTSRLDGKMTITAKVTDLAQNQSTCSIAVTVDNMSVQLCPNVLVLFKGRLLRLCRLPAVAKVQGVNTDLLTPCSEHDIQLQIPGGSPVPAIGCCTACNSLKIMFDRKDLGNSIRAGIQSGVIPTPRLWHPVQVRIKLVADGFVIGSVPFTISDPLQR